MPIMPRKPTLSFWCVRRNYSTRIRGYPCSHIFLASYNRCWSFVLWSKRPTATKMYGFPNNCIVQNLDGTITPNELSSSPMLSVLHHSNLLQNLCIEFVDFGRVETMTEILKQVGLQEMNWINDLPAVHLKGFCNLTWLKLYSLHGSEKHLIKDICSILVDSPGRRWIPFPEPLCDVRLTFRVSISS